MSFFLLRSGGRLLRAGRLNVRGILWAVCLQPEFEGWKPSFYIICPR